MDCLYERFPHLSKSILNNLDNQSLLKSKEASREIFQFLENERFYWIRMIGRKYWTFKGFQESWKEVVHQTPTDVVKELANEVQTLFTNQNVCSLRTGPMHPLHIVALQGNLKLYKHVVSKMKDKNPCGRLISQRGKFMLPTIGDHNMYRPVSGATSLHMAAMNGNYEVCKYICENSDNENQKNHLNVTPLEIAAANGHLQVVKFLFESVVEEDQRNQVGWTPLHFAASSGHTEIYQYLYQNSVNKNPRDGGGVTPLHIAAYHGHSNMFEVVENSMDKNPADNNGSTPLHLAAQEGYFETCKLIISNVKDKHPIDNFGETPRDLVDKYNQPKTRSIMLALFDNQLS